MVCSTLARRTCSNGSHASMVIAFCSYKSTAQCQIAHFPSREFEVMYPSFPRARFQFPLDVQSCSLGTLRTCTRFQSAPPQWTKSVFGRKRLLKILTLHCIPISWTAQRSPALVSISHRVRRILLQHWQLGTCLGLVVLVPRRDPVSSSQFPLICSSTKTMPCS